MPFFLQQRKWTDKSPQHHISKLCWLGYVWSCWSLPENFPLIIDRLCFREDWRCCWTQANKHLHNWQSPFSSLCSKKVINFVDPRLTLIANLRPSGLLHSPFFHLLTFYHPWASTTVVTIVSSRFEQKEVPSSFAHFLPSESFYDWVSTSSRAGHRVNLYNHTWAVQTISVPASIKKDKLFRALLPPAKLNHCFSLFTLSWVGLGLLSTPEGGQQDAFYYKVDKIMPSEMDGSKLLYLRLHLLDLLERFYKGVSSISFANSYFQVPVHPGGVQRARWWWLW